MQSSTLKQLSKQKNLVYSKVMKPVMNAAESPT